MTTCPKCDTEFEAIPSWDSGSCPKCGKKYCWDEISFEDKDGCWDSLPVIDWRIGRNYKKVDDYKLCLKSLLVGINLEKLDIDRFVEYATEERCLMLGEQIARRLRILLKQRDLLEKAVMGEDAWDADDKEAVASRIKEFKEDGVDIDKVLALVENEKGI
jgi:hypothetical protein